MNAISVYPALILGGYTLSLYLGLEHCHKTKPDSKEWIKISVTLWEMLLGTAKLCPCAESAIFTRFWTHFL